MEHDANFVHYNITKCQEIIKIISKAVMSKHPQMENERQRDDESLITLLKVDVIKILETHIIYSACFT